MYNENYYIGYLLNDDFIVLDDYEKLLFECCVWIVENNSSIRDASRNFGISKSKLHRDIHSRVKTLSWELYRCVLYKLQEHKKGV